MTSAPPAAGAGAGADPSPFIESGARTKNTIQKNYSDGGDIFFDNLNKNCIF